MRYLSQISPIVLASAVTASWLVFAASPSYAEPSYSGHATANGITLLAIAGAVIEKKNAEVARLTGRPFSDEEKWNIRKEVAAQLLTGPETYAAFAGGGRVVTLANPLIRSIDNPSDPRSLKPLRASRALLANAIGTVAFLGGAATISTLWRQAVSQLPPEDRTKARNIIASVSASVRKPTVSAGIDELAEHNRVLRQIVKNMGHIIASPKGRSLWLDNTFRKEIANGRFLTSAAGMAAGGTIGGVAGAVIGPPVGAAIGSVAMPGVGTWVGALEGAEKGPMIGVLVGSVAGAIGTVYLIPDSVSDYLSEKIRKGQNWIGRRRLDACVNTLTVNFRLSESESYNQANRIGRGQLLQRLADCEKIRAAYATIVMDSVNDLQQHREWMDMLCAVAREEHQSAEATDRCEKAVVVANATIYKAVRELIDFYGGQTSKMKKLADELKHPLGSGLVMEEARRMARVALNLQNALEKEESPDTDVGQSVAEASEQGFNEGLWSREMNATATATAR